MTIAELHQWATDNEGSSDPRTRSACVSAIALMNERSQLVSTDYITLREDLRIIQAGNAAYKRENARLRALTAAPWENSNDSGRGKPK